MSVTAKAFIPLCHKLGQNGHFTFSWEPASDTTAEKLIQQKMDEGMVFWFVPTGPFAKNRGKLLSKLTHIQDVPEDRKVVIEDEDLAKFLQSGGGRVVPNADEDEEDMTPTSFAGRARTAREVLENDTIAHRPLRGG